jgi:hypothetical protein
MSKLYVVLIFICTCVMSASVIRPPKPGHELKAVSVLTAGQMKLLRAASEMKNANQANSSVMASENGDQMLGQHSTVCTDGGWYAPCNGDCYRFDDINSIVVSFSQN